MRVPSLVAAIVLLSLSGCNVLGPQEQPKVVTHTISMPLPRNVPTCANPLTLMVSTPTASSGYNTKKMIYNERCYELATFTRNEWAGPPAEMIQPLLVQKLRDTGYFHAVVASPFSANRSLVLKTNLLELRQDFTLHPSHVVIALQVELINNHTEEVINSKTFARSVPTKLDTPDSGVVTINCAMNQLLNEVAQFAVSSAKAQQEDE